MHLRSRFSVFLKIHSASWQRLAEFCRHGEQFYLQGLMRYQWSHLALWSCLWLSGLWVGSPGWVEAKQPKPVSAVVQDGQTHQSGLSAIARALQPIHFAELYYQLGNALHQQEKLDVAAQAYQQALRLNPQYEPALINQGLTWIELGRFELAIANFKRVLKLPDQVLEPASYHTLAYYNLGIIYNRLGEHKQALKAVEAALKINPSFSRAKTLLQQITANPNPPM